MDVGNKNCNPFTVRISANMMMAIATICNKKHITASDFARSAFIDAIAKEIYLVENGGSSDQMIFDGDKIITLGIDRDYIERVREYVNGE